MTNPATSLLLALIALGALVPAAQAQHRVATDSAPRALVDQVLRDQEANGDPGILRDELDAGGWDGGWLAVVDRVDLDGDGKAELFVQGRGRVCGAANCLTWIYRVTSHGYERVFYANGVQSIEARQTVSHGYRDLLTSTHDSFDRSYLTLYRFDGERYRAAECSRRDYTYLDAKGRVHELREPRITRLECDADAG